MSVFLMSFLTLARRTSVSSLDHPRPFSSIGLVKSAREKAASALMTFSWLQMPIVSLVSRDATDNVLYLRGLTQLLILLVPRPAVAWPLFLNDVDVDKASIRQLLWI